MRDAFIQALDKIVGVLVILGFLLVIGAALAAMFGGAPNSGIGVALGILVGGTLSVVVMAGLMSLFLGTYANTERMADATGRPAGQRVDP